MEPLGEVGGLWDVCAFVQTTATGTIRSPLAFTLRSVGCMYPKGPVYPNTIYFGPNVPL